MDILQNERERFFTEVGFARLTHGTGGRIGPKGLVVRAPIIVAGQPEPARPPEDEEGGRKWQSTRPPSRFGAKQAVRGVSQQFRGIKRRDVRPPKIVRSLKGGPGRIHYETGEP